MTSHTEKATPNLELVYCGGNTGFVIYGSYVFVFVPKGHPWHGRNNDTIYDKNLEIQFPPKFTSRAGVEFTGDVSMLPDSVRSLISISQYSRMHNWFLGWNFAEHTGDRNTFSDILLSDYPIAIFDEDQDADVIAEIKSKTINVCLIARNEPPEP